MKQIILRPTLGQRSAPQTARTLPNGKIRFELREGTRAIELVMDYRGAVEFLGLINSALDDLDVGRMEDACDSIPCEFQNF